MRWQIRGHNGEGQIFYDTYSKKMEVAYTEESTLNHLIDYLTQEREFFQIVLDHPDGGWKIRGVPTDSLSFITQTLSEIEHKFGVLFTEINVDKDSFEHESSELEGQQDQYPKVVKFTAHKKQTIDILSKLREYQDRYEYQFVEQYEEKFRDFQSNSMQIGDIFPQLLDLGDRMVLVSLDFYKNKFRLVDIVRWLEKNNIVLGNKGSNEVIIKDAHELIQGIKFYGYPIVAYSRGNKRINVDATKLVEITDKFICEPIKIDTSESKDVQVGLTVVYNDKVLDGIPRIDLDMSQDLVVCNGTVVVADYIGEYHGCLAFFRNDEEIPVSFVLDTNTTIYIDCFERDNTGAITYIIKYRYIVDLESLYSEGSTEEDIKDSAQICDDQARFSCFEFKTNGDGYEKVWIVDNEGRQGTIEYFEKEKTVIVQHPIPEVEEVVKKYLNSERNYLLPYGSSCIPLPVELVKPTESIQFFDIAVNEMYSRTGIHVRWGEPEPKVHKVIRTVPYDPTKSGEGTLSAEDGSIICDDAWLHQDLLGSENEDGDKK